MRRDLERPIRRFMRALAHLVLFVVALPGRGLAQPGAAGDIVQARELFVQAMEERDSGNAKDALAKFKAAHTMAANPVTAIELGRTYAMLGMLVEARATLLPIADLPIQPEETSRAAEARRDAAPLADAIGRRIPMISVKVSGGRGSTRSITVDGTGVPVERLVPSLPLDPGPHVVIATDSTGARADAKIDLKEGELREVVLVIAEPALPGANAVAVPPATLLPRGTPEPSASQSPEPSARVSGSGPTAIVGLGVGAAGFLTGAALGAVALSKISGIADTCSDVTCAQNAIDELRSARTLAYSSIISFALGGAGLVVGVVALLSGSNAGPSTATAVKSRGARGPFVVPWVGPCAAGLRGSF